MKKNDELLAKFVQDIEDFLENTQDARFLSERDRDYKDNKQWTAEERAKVEKRWQAVVTINRIKPKVEGLKGLLIQRKTDPKAYARTKKHEKAAEAITDALRYVADQTKLDRIKLDVADNDFVEGYGAAIVEVEMKGNDPIIQCTHIPWDRYYYDYHSRKLDFQDKRWDGIILWMDQDVVQEAFGLSEKQVEELYHESGKIGASGDETFDDRPRWADRENSRIRICQHYYIEKGKWYVCYFTYNKMLIDPELSPYVDEYGESINPIEAVSANMDRDNNRFGEVRYWIDLQDEINHRRSKFLFLLSQRQTMAKRGSIQDVAALKRELAKPDGHVEYDGEKGDFDLLPTSDMAQGQFQLLQEAKSELDAVGFNTQISNERQGDLANSAIMTLQQASTNELNSLYEGLLDWENRVYRQFWFRIKQFWKEEKWLRVLDDRTKLRWVGLNQKVTFQEILEERINDESAELPAKQAAQDMLAQLTQQKSPELKKIVETRNEVSNLDVDIIIETSYDLVNIQREQFDMLFKLAQVRPEVPFTEILKMSELRNKDAMVKNIEASAQAQQQAAQQAQQQEMQLRGAELQSDAALSAAKTEREKAEARKKMVEADQTIFQTDLMIRQPPKDSAVVI